MNVLRLTKNLSMHNGDPFILFYGKVNDQFCDDDLVLGNIDFMLWRYFKRQGYERIVFFDGASKITFYDDQSRALCLPQASSSRPGHSSLAGPLGSRNLLRSPSATPGEASPPSPALAPGTSSSVSGGTLREQSRMSDLSALEIFDAIIQRTDPAHPTVVIFSVAEDIRNFQQSGFREIQNRMVQWIRSSSPGERKCVFIFQQSTLEEVKSLAQTHELHSVANFVKEKQDDTSNMVGVRFPDEHELANLVHYHRLQNRLSVDWKILARLVQFLAKQRLLMRRWHAMISEIKRLDKDTLLQWNERKAIKSTAHLIQNLEKDANVLDKQSLDKQLSLVQDQEDSIFQLKEALEVWYAQVAKGRPLSFFLAGTSGVGKTYTVKLLAKALEPLGYEYCYFAMTEFMQEHTVANLIGSPRGYVGSEEEPRLFAALNRSPRLIICFDEIEKAHKQILTSLMQLLDEGFLSWNRGEGNFKECLICFTSNAQRQQMVALKQRFQQSGQSTAAPEFQQAVRDILVRAGVAPEVCGRINKFLVYNPLTPEAVMKITGREIEKLGRSYGLEVVSTAPEFQAAVAARTANSIYGARPVREEVQAQLGRPLSGLKKRSPAVERVAIQKEGSGYQAIPADEAGNILSYDEMIESARKLIPAGNETASGAGIKLGDRPKRVLHLQEIPTSLPGESEPALPGENSLDQVRPAVGYVEVQEQDGNEGSGSGFVITPDGKFITSYHVVENAVSIRARFDNRPQEWITAELVDGDKEADIALLKLQGGQFPYALIAPYGDRVERGENVGLLGYPLGGDLASTVTYTEGVLSNFKEQSNGVSLLQFDANAYHGNSGGPLFRRRDGQIIGILMGTWKEVDQINFAVSINELYKRLIREY
ncbi:AAA family ATPase [Thermodesulfovibrionales bacterium]|nr:AAA family ATPase [Thermodesulfovibrionales bacterium]